MPWQVEFTDQFAEWWKTLDENEQASIDWVIARLEEWGPALTRPYVETLSHISEHPNLKELRIAHHGDAYRVIFAFDPRRVAILLWGGRKPDEKWYKRSVPRADRLYDDHLRALRREGLM
jgi:hypothetical protein